ncbi:MAG TPA: hypothetical protein VIK37_02075 [Candidatus Saccharimonadales bacterium]
MRKELLEEGKTLKEIGAREGVTAERIRQVVGNLNRENSRTKVRQEQVRVLAEAGKSDEEIAAKLGLGVRRVADLRVMSGIYRPAGGKKWTSESILQKAREWHKHFGYTPAVADWHPAQAVRQGHLERVNRYYEFEAPPLRCVQKVFGSWSEMIRQSGLPPAPRGNAARGYWIKGRPAG